METNVVRNAKFVKVIGIITTTLFLSVSVFLILTGNLLASLFFLPFAALGIILILAYKKEKILLEKESLTICRLFGASPLPGCRCRQSSTICRKQASMCQLPLNRPASHNYPL